MNADTIRFLVLLAFIFGMPCLALCGGELYGRIEARRDRRCSR